MCFVDIMEEKTENTLFHHLLVLIYLGPFFFKSWRSFIKVIWGLNIVKWSLKENLWVLEDHTLKLRLHFLIASICSSCCFSNFHLLHILSFPCFVCCLCWVAFIIFASLFLSSWSSFLCYCCCLDLFIILVYVFIFGKFAEFIDCFSELSSSKNCPTMERDLS